MDLIHLEIQTDLVEKLKSELQEIKKLYQMAKGELILALGNSESERIVGKVESEMNRNARKLEAIKRRKLTNLLREQEKDTMGSGTGGKLDKRIRDRRESIESIETRMDNVRSEGRERCKIEEKNEYVIRKEEKQRRRKELMKVREEKWIELLKRAEIIREDPENKIHWTGRNVIYHNP